MFTPSLPEYPTRVGVGHDPMIGGHSMSFGPGESPTPHVLLGYQMRTGLPTDPLVCLSILILANGAGGNDADWHVAVTSLEQVKDTLG